MKRKIGLIMAFCLLLSVIPMGCTAPTQVIAEDALQRAKDEDHKVINDLSNRAKQGALDKVRTKVHAAMATDSTADADAAILAFMNELDKIHFMQITHERALRLLGVAETYIWEQRGWFDILSEEWAAAKKIVDAREKAEKAEKPSG